MLPTLSAAQLAVLLGQDDECALVRATLVEAVAGGAATTEPGLPGGWRPAGPRPWPVPLDAVATAAGVLAAGHRLVDHVPPTLVAPDAVRLAWVRELRRRVVTARGALGTAATDEDSGPFGGHRAVAAVLGTLGTAASLVFLDLGLLATLRGLTCTDGPAAAGPRASERSSATGGAAGADPRRVGRLLVALERLTPEVLDDVERALRASLAHDR